MQTVSMLRTTALVSSSAQRCNRTTFRANLAPAAPRRTRTLSIRAEADNTGGSITNSGQTKGKDSYEVLALITFKCLEASACRIFCVSHFRVSPSHGCLTETYAQAKVVVCTPVCSPWLRFPLQKIEAPVRSDDSADKSYAYGGKPIGDRQSDVDRLLVDQNEPEEQRFLGTEVAFPDALRFKGAAPEVANSRCRTAVFMCMYPR